MKYKKLREIMSERGVSVNELSKKAEISCVILFLRVWGFKEFKAWEILRISQALSLRRNQIEDIFFDSKSFLKETKERGRHGNY